MMIMMTVFVAAFFLKDNWTLHQDIAKIVYYDIARFTGVFLVIFLAFCGAFFLSLRATNAVQVFG